MQRILSSEVHAHSGEHVRLAGWIHTIRDFREVKFLVLRDRGGLVQTVIDPGSPLHEVKLGREFCVEIEGRVETEPRARGGFEVHIIALEVVATAEEPPLEINRPAKMARTHLDKILDHRAISLRAPEIRAVFKVQSELVFAFGEFLRAQDFTEVKTSKIVATGTEGGANLFAIDYFGRPAYLAQSPQFYKQIMVGTGFERVFEVGPVYRAEKHETARHINEYTSLDYEMGFIRDEQDVIAMQVGLVRHMMEAVRERCAREIELIGATVPVVGATIPQVTFAEALEIIKREGQRGMPPGDLDPEGERLLCEWSARERGSEFLYVVGFPLAQRPMYTNYREDDPLVSRAFDLLLRGLEVTSGSQRIHEYDKLVERMLKVRLNPEHYDYYLSAFRHGMPPHGGLAIGLERLTKQILGLSNVKLATLFPRDRHRLTP